jgi:hypothetical protein
MDRMFPGELISHLEFVRFDGDITCFGLPLVKFTTEERLEEIMDLHNEHGCPIFNPHRYTLEEGGMKQTDEIQLAFKREADPKGLLNPGKMIAWDDPDYDFELWKDMAVQGLETGKLRRSDARARGPCSPGWLKFQCEPVPHDGREAARQRPRGRCDRSLSRWFQSGDERGRTAQLS